MNKSESIKELAVALCNFQREVQKIKKTEINPFFKNKYADLSSILDVVRQPLVDNGLSVAQFPTGKYELETILMHTSGEWMSATYEMEPTKRDPQGLGSVITYQRRYALGAILQLNIDIDDDGNKASEPAKQPEKKVVKKETIESLHEILLTTTIEGLQAIWNKYPELHEDSTFKEEIKKQKIQILKL